MGGDWEAQGSRRGGRERKKRTSRAGGRHVWEEGQTTGWRLRNRRVGGWLAVYRDRQKASWVWAQTQNGKVFMKIIAEG